MFWKRFEGLCALKGMKPNSEKARTEIGISSGIITSWKNGTIPNGETLIKLSTFFECSVDYLLGLSDNSKIISEKKLSSELSEDKQRLLDMYDLLTEREQGEILGELKSLTRNRAEVKNAETA